VSRADLGPLRAVGRLVAGERIAGAGQPQPAGGLRGDPARAAGYVLDEVVLHPHAVAAGEQHRRVGRSLLRALFDHDSGLGPRHHAGNNLVVLGRRISDDAGQRRHAGGDAAVSGQRLVQEIELIDDRFAIRPQRNRGADLAVWTLKRRMHASREEQAERHDDQRRDRHADQASAARPECGSFHTQQVRETLALGFSCSHHQLWIARHVGTPVRSAKMPVTLVATVLRRVSCSRFAILDRLFTLNPLTFGPGREVARGTCRLRQRSRSTFPLLPRFCVFRPGR
jgi:hypothetical protein